MKKGTVPGFFSSVQIAFINEDTEGYLGKAGLLKLTRDICIKKGTVPGNTGRMGTLLESEATKWTRTGIELGSGSKGPPALGAERSGIADPSPVSLQRARVPYKDRG
jgi:hypothetical protein